MRTLLAVGVPLMFTACATIAPPQPPSLFLPKPPTDLRATRKGDRVILNWTVPTTTTDRQTLRTLGATEICRTLSPDMQECGTPVAKSSASVVPEPGKPSKKKASETYTDKIPGTLLSDDPSIFATYAVEVLNKEGKGAGVSNRVHVPLVRTLPPPQDFGARVTRDGVVLSWTAQVPKPPAGAHYVYRVYRQMEDQKDQTLVKQLDVGDQHSFTVTDSDIEWEKTYQYWAETVTILNRPNNQELPVEGDDTPEVKVFADDVFPPAVPSGLQAVFSGPGQQRFIDLIWAPVPDLDLAGYNVYRRTDGAAAIKVNPGLVKTPAYRDPDVEPGRKYYYSATSVDLRGNESAHSEEASEVALQQ